LNQVQKVGVSLGKQLDNKKMFSKIAQVSRKQKEEEALKKLKEMKQK
jgi:hypothetical protein